MKIYKVIPQPSTIIIKKNESAQNAIEKFYAVLGQECVDGWEFHSNSQVAVTRKLGKFKSKVEVYNAFVFSKDAEEVTHNCQPKADIAQTAKQQPVAEDMAQNKVEESEDKNQQPKTEGAQMQNDVTAQQPEVENTQGDEQVATAQQGEQPSENQTQPENAQEGAQVEGEVNDANAQEQEQPTQEQEDQPTENA